MNNLPILLVVFAVTIAVEQAAPIIKDNNTTSTIQHNIAVLKVKAQEEAISIYQEITLLETYNGEKYDTHYNGCYVRFEPTNDVDVNTLKDDVKSFKQLLPVIEELAANETNATILDYYRKIIYSTNNSIVALNNLIAALESNNDEGEEKENEKEEEEYMGSGGDNTTQIKPTDSSEDDEMDVKSQSETDQCKNLDKAAKLSALKVQAILTCYDVSEVLENQYNVTNKYKNSLCVI